MLIRAYLLTEGDSLGAVDRSLCVAPFVASLQATPEPAARENARDEPDRANRLNNGFLTHEQIQCRNRHHHGRG